MDHCDTATPELNSSNLIKLENVVLDQNYPNIDNASNVLGNILQNAQPLDEEPFHINNKYNTPRDIEHIRPSVSSGTDKCNNLDINQQN